MEGDIKHGVGKGDENEGSGGVREGGKIRIVLELEELMIGEGRMRLVGVGEGGEGLK